VTFVYVFHQKFLEVRIDSKECSMGSDIESMKTRAKNVRNMHSCDIQHMIGFCKLQGEGLQPLPT